ncbi:ALK tyrosine kinase receptor [Tachysurus ichikawai]
MSDTESEPKMAEGAGLVSESQASPSASSPEETNLTPGEEEGYSGPALTPNSPTSLLLRPLCLLLLLILLVLSFLGSWAVVHLSLGARGTPFRISSSYDQPGEPETATYDPLFITNCTMGKKSG